MKKFFVNLKKLDLYVKRLNIPIIIGINLLGEGLRLEFDKRSSRIITWISGIPSFLSPARLIYEIKNIDT